VGIIHRHADLRRVSLAQNVGKDERMLIDHPILVSATFHDPIRNLVEIESRHIIREPPGGVGNRPASAGGVLMQDLQVSRIDGIFHRLKPIAVELRLNEYFSVAVLPHPNIVFRNQRRRLGAHIGPVQACQALYRIGFLLYGQAKFAASGLRRTFKAIALSIVQPAVVRARNPALLDAAIR
jgi:hypothetical protein